MKKQHDLILLAPEEYNNYYSIIHSKKISTNKYNHRTINGIINNHPFSTEYETINVREKSPFERIRIKNTFHQKLSPLPLISKKGLLYNTNRLLTLNKKSLEGFKPIEDKQIRNKFKIKNIKSPVSIQYLSLDEKRDQFDNYVISLFRKRKNKLNIQNQRYTTNNETFFNSKNLKQKLRIINKYLNKKYEKEKKQFKNYYKDNQDYLKELLTIEILNKTSRLKFIDDNKTINNNNRLYTQFSPISKEIFFNKYKSSYEGLKKIQNAHIKSCLACYNQQLLTEN